MSDGAFFVLLCPLSMSDFENVSSFLPCQTILQSVVGVLPNSDSNWSYPGPVAKGSDPQNGPFCSSYVNHNQ